MCIYIYPTSSSHVLVLLSLQLRLFDASGPAEKVSNKKPLGPSDKLRFAHPQLCPCPSEVSGPWRLICSAEDLATIFLEVL